MDYLREITLRQAALLARLLTGEAPSEETPEAQGPTGAGRLFSAEREAETSRFPESGAAVPAETTERRWMAETGRGRRDGTELTEETAVPAAENDEGSRTPAAHSSRGGLDAAAETFYQERQADAVWRGNPPWSRGRMAAVAVRQETALDVEAVSRAVQRDARRYDGGFTMY